MSEKTEVDVDKKIGGLTSSLEPFNHSFPIWSLPTCLPTLFLVNTARSHNESSRFDCLERQKERDGEGEGERERESKGMALWWWDTKRRC